MTAFALNHMSVPQVTAAKLLEMAAQLGCVGVEFRNDLAAPMFAKSTPAEIGAMARDMGLRVLGLAEVSAFNARPEMRVSDAGDLIEMAKDSGAEGVALIPQVASGPVDRDTQRSALRLALRCFQPALEDAGLVGLIEPLGFEASSLRHKEDVVAILDEVGRPACFGMIHDTFHHHLSGDAALYPELTKLVHISGVVANVAVGEMTDAHRVLVDAGDRLGNVAQLAGLRRGGCLAPASFEAFAPDVHALSDPVPALARSIDFLTSHTSAVAA